jgi:transcriptional regulator with XRE-family HTH domain
MKRATAEPASAPRLTGSPDEPGYLYAAGEGKPLVDAREALRWNQSEVARRSGTSSPMVSQLEGLVGRRVSRAKAEAIANVLGREIDELFTTVAPPAELFGKRWRAATPASERYDGSGAKAEQARWQAYLERARDSDEPIFEWPSPLSLVRAAERFGLDRHTLANAADAKRVSGRRTRGRGPGGVEWQFDERTLAEELETLPACRYDGCDLPALGPSGGCERHGHALVQQGTTLSEEVRSRQIAGHLAMYADPERGPQCKDRIAAAKRGKPRPDVRERVAAMHADREQRYRWGIALAKGRNLPPGSKGRWHGRLEALKAGRQGGKKPVEELLPGKAQEALSLLANGVSIRKTAAKTGLTKDEVEGVKARSRLSP